jgi:CDP-diacylglycerol--glycerol-3-phosphate 3-phosphatidyltransferase
VPEKKHCFRRPLLAHESRASLLSELETGSYRWRDVFLAPGLLSLARAPLAFAFPFVVERTAWALAVIVLAGVTDVLDGWCARRFGQATPTGAALDPITDKLFVLTVAITLVASGHFSLVAVLLLSTREVLELPLVVWFALSPSARSARAEKPMANALGKLATVLQFAAVFSTLLGWSITGVWIGATAVVGVFAALSYWLRALGAGARR